MELGLGATEQRLMRIGDRHESCVGTGANIMQMFPDVIVC
jgi:hypothetical protein